MPPRQRGHECAKTLNEKFQQIYNQDYSHHPGRQKRQYQKAQIDKAIKKPHKFEQIYHLDYSNHQKKQIYSYI